MSNDIPADDINTTKSTIAPSGVYRKIWTRQTIILSLIITAILSSVLGVSIFLLIK
ncbi:MAG: hypothetical protein LBT99_04655 [Bifidobacteriaceae bacterium]|jgi:hypothetical protein|nr:hypothetical protein [Bifidobacteriaceae bacterium]